MRSKANEPILLALQEVVGTTLKCWLDENKPEVLQAVQEAVTKNSLNERKSVRTAPKSEPQFMDTSEIAIRWRLNPETVRRMVRDGRLPRAPLSGRRILVPTSAIVSREEGQA